MLASGLFVAFLGSICGASLSVCGASGAGNTIKIIYSLGLISSIPVLIGSLFINKGDSDSLRKGSILVLIFGVLGLVFGAWGELLLMIIGSVLALIGGYMGYTLKPTP